MSLTRYLFICLAVSSLVADLPPERFAISAEDQDPRTGADITVRSARSLRILRISKRLATVPRYRINTTSATTAVTAAAAATPAAASVSSVHFSGRGEGVCHL
jgi:hypothetical protein